MFRIFLLFGLLFSLSAQADLQYARWTYKETKVTSLEATLERINQATGFSLKPSDFIVFEDRNLAFNHFKMWVQVSGGLPIDGASIRLWSDLEGGLIQAESFVQDPSKSEGDRLRLAKLGFTVARVQSFSQKAKIYEKVEKLIHSDPDDSHIRSVKTDDRWMNGDLVRVFKVKGRRGYHTVIWSLTFDHLVIHTYEPFKDSGASEKPSEIIVPAKVYPIYEEVEGGDGSVLPRVDSYLRFIKTQVPRVIEDPYTELKTKRYFEPMYNPLLGETEVGRSMGYWAPSYIKREAMRLLSLVPLSPNNFQEGGVVLEGRFCSVNIHPDAREKLEGKVPLSMGGHYMARWVQSEFQGKDVWEMIPSTSLLGRPLNSVTDAYNRSAARLKDHDFVQYAKDGFDEVQVYWAVTRFFEGLIPMGFQDPELSQRPFHAFLYDPDISMQDNAYYTDDTINFTTYTSGTPNYARDNHTIWHELGHGLMDRLMGDVVTLAGAGGLSEGNADFVADILVQDVMQGKAFPGSDKFRYMNKIGFNLTNEVHDDGEAYGGGMHDLLQLALAKFGRTGLVKVADLYLESMRLTRNHPNLDDKAWYDHMLFADELGRPGIRAAGELRSLILQTLTHRNFSLNGEKTALFSLKHNDVEVDSNAPGSRNRPIPVSIKEADSKAFQLSLSLADGENYKFKYPVTVKVGLEKGPLQGAIHWMGEENEPLVFEVRQPGDVVNVDLSVSGKCDYFNRDDQSCVDFAYIQVFNKGETEMPQAKKRFYLRVKASDKGTR